MLSALETLDSMELVIQREFVEKSFFKISAEILNWLSVYKCWVFMLELSAPTKVGPTLDLVPLDLESVVLVRHPNLLFILETFLETRQWSFLFSHTWMWWRDLWEHNLLPISLTITTGWSVWCNHLQVQLRYLSSMGYWLNWN